MSFASLRPQTSEIPSIHTRTEPVQSLQPPGITDAEASSPIEDRLRQQHLHLDDRYASSNQQQSEAGALPTSDVSPSVQHHGPSGLQVRYAAQAGDACSFGRERFGEQQHLTALIAEERPESNETTSSPQEHPSHPPAHSTGSFQHLKTSAWLAFFSIWGTLARLGLTALTDYNGAPIGGVIWANFAGCLVMGFAIHDKKLFAFVETVAEKDSATGAKPSKKTLPLYVGITTGFCGSLTSFSSFMLDSFKHLANVAPAFPNRPTKGYNLLALLAYMIATLSLSFAGLQFGAQLSIFLHRFTPTLSRKAVHFLDWAIIPTGLACWMASILMAVYTPKWRGDALFACVFSPLGVYGRYWVSRLLNPRISNFPLGTFMVNIVGTGFLAALSTGRSIVNRGVGCALMKGAGDGFCGCLTTVSTFVAEAKSLRASHGYFYAGLSVTVGLCMMVAVLGSYVGFPVSLFCCFAVFWWFRRFRC